MECKKLFCGLTIALFIALIPGSAHDAHAGQYGSETIALQDAVDINTATLENLQKIKGIGPKLARRIIEFRKINGTFETIQDIVRVRGIGKAKFDEIKDAISV